jgi:hypothetical protein
LAIQTCHVLHLKGSFNTKQFFKFITRFGFESTDVHKQTLTQGYIYGNITSKQKDVKQKIMLSVMDYNYFIDYYNKHHFHPTDSACPMMFENIEKKAYFYECNEAG